MNANNTRCYNKNADFKQGQSLEQAGNAYHLNQKLAYSKDGHMIAGDEEQIKNGSVMKRRDDYNRGDIGLN